MQSKVSKSKRLLVLGIFIIVVFGGLVAFNIVKGIMVKRYFAHFKQPPVTISATKAKLENWHPSITAVGTLKAVNGVNVTAQTAGLITKIFFQSGQAVKQGEPLLQLYDATEIQDLKNYQAKEELARLGYQRQAKLKKQNATSLKAYDEAKADFQQTQAMVNKTKALIKQKTIDAPFSGRLGIRQVNVGQYINPGADIVSLQSLNPLFVDFYLPEQQIPKLRVGQSIQVTVDTVPGKQFVGKINAISVKIDPSSHNVLVQATLPNPKHRLYPGLFANIKVDLPQVKHVVTVPQTAIAYSLYGDSIYVIKDGMVHQQFVRIGSRQGNHVAIVEGLKAGQEVVTSGQLKLNDGARVVINNTVNIQ